MHCPFCGSEQAFLEYSTPMGTDKYPFDSVQVICKDCNKAGPLVEYVPDLGDPIILLSKEIAEMAAISLWLSLPVKHHS